MGGSLTNSFTFCLVLVIDVIIVYYASYLLLIHFKTPVTRLLEKERFLQFGGPFQTGTWFWELVRVSRFSMELPGDDQGPVVHDGYGDDEEPVVVGVPSRINHSDLLGPGQEQINQ